MVFIGDCNVCSAFFRLVISSCINVGSEVFYLLDSNDVLYRNTSSSCAMPYFCFSLSMFIGCGASWCDFWYASWIILIYSSILSFPFSLHWSSSSANKTWIWCVCFSISFWIMFCNSLYMLNMFPPVCTLYVSLACSIVVLISAN